MRNNESPMRRDPKKAYMFDLLITIMKIFSGEVNNAPLN